MVSQHMKQVTLSSKDAAVLLQDYTISVSKKDLVQKVQTDTLTFLSINKELCFFDYDGKYVPTLRYLQTHSLLKTITVDMGAIKFVVNGADIMRPGIAEIAVDIQKDEFIVIVDINNKKPIAVGIALFRSQEMQSMSTGKVIKNIHYVGDEIWKFNSD